MCGIVGFIDFNKKLGPVDLKKMTQSLTHRGPDDEGEFFNELHEANIGFGHRRLSIIELSHLGHQPMRFENLTITYNGEIYNFSEVKFKLEQNGYTFISKSDTEVILKAFHCWGVPAIDYFVGMFAIAIFDSASNKIFLIRDRAGIKPIYMYSQNGIFAFASEIKAFFQFSGFKKELDPNSVGSYLKYGYIPTPSSIFKNVEKIKPGHIFELNVSNRKINYYAYWDLFDFYNKTKLNISVSEAVTELEYLINKSCRLRLVSDVPVGIFLSGGYDSSLVAAIIQKERTDKIKTFSIGFKESEFNESHHAGKVAAFLGTDHSEYIIDFNDVKDEIHSYSDIYDEPFNDTSGLLVSMISKRAVAKLKVVLTGDGAEEVFAGYDSYVPGNIKYDFLALLPSSIKHGVDHIAGLLLKYEQNRSNRFLKSFNIIKTIFGIPLNGSNRPIILKDNLLKASYELKTNYFFDNHKINSNNDVYNRLLAIDFKTRLLDDFLVKIDRATMYHGLESREPLLDHRIIEFAAQLPCQLKCYDNTTKYLLKTITHKYLPDEMMNRPKMGFALPIEEWFRSDLKDLFLDVLSESSMNQSGLFNVNFALQLREKFLSNRLDYYSSKKIISIFLFQLWYKKWMK